MVRLRRGIYKGTFVAAALATATMLACATTPESCASRTAALRGIGATALEERARKCCGVYRRGWCVCYER